MSKLTTALLQAPFVIGNPIENAKILDAMIQQAIDSGAELIITPECALSGYLPEDLLFRDDQLEQINLALEKLLQKSYPATIVVGLPVLENNALFNRAVVIDHGKIIASYDKQSLPNYRVFDEKRYFVRGHSNTTFKMKGINIGVYICEDLWDRRITDVIDAENLDLIVSLNASPYYLGKPEERMQLLKHITQTKHLPIAYVNCVGGQDSLLFDGGSTVINSDGSVCSLANDFEKQILLSTIDFNHAPSCSSSTKPRVNNPIKQMVEGISTGIAAYVKKNHFQNGVLVALSGGIDSAVTLSLAVKALGADKVEAVYMPTQFNADISEIDAKAQADALGVKFSVLPIEDMTASINQALTPYFHGQPRDITEENIQARLRGLLIMALSNKRHKLVLTTGNKSEYAVGYATLYGDMCGGYAPIKDVYKTQVYAMAHQLNEMGWTIPERVITREPSAELSPDQLDSHSLPPYEILDRILQLFIEEDLAIEKIQQQTGYELETIKKVVAMVLRNEYKRQQSAPGPRVSKRAFGKDRRYPISMDSNIYK